MNIREKGLIPSQVRCSVDCQTPAGCAPVASHGASTACLESSLDCLESPGSVHLLQLYLRPLLRQTHPSPAWACTAYRHDPHIPPIQGPTGTRYPTRTRSFFQYPIRTRFVFKIIGYFGYRVFQKTIFLTWKTLSRSYKILTNIILYHLHLSRCQGKL